MMKAMILAAGRGERLRPLTDTTPKPLIEVAGKSLLEYHLINLVDAGIKEIVINTAWLADKIHEKLGDGSQYGVSIQYSDEGEALETAGGIINALPLLGDEPFLVVNGDIWCDFDFNALPDLNTNKSILAHLILVENPEHNSEGDFSLVENLVRNAGDAMYTFSGIGLYHPDFFTEQPTGTSPLAPLIRNYCEKNLVSGEYYDGQWTDVGTVERLEALNNILQK